MEKRPRRFKTYNSDCGAATLVCVENLENIYVVFAITIRSYNVDALVPDRKASGLASSPQVSAPC